MKQYANLSIRIPCPHLELQNVQATADMENGDMAGYGEFFMTPASLVTVELEGIIKGVEDKQ